MPAVCHVDLQNLRIRAGASARNWTWRSPPEQACGGALRAATKRMPGAPKPGDAGSQGPSSNDATHETMIVDASVAVKWVVFVDWCERMMVTTRGRRSSTVL